MSKEELNYLLAKVKEYLEYPTEKSLGYFFTEDIAKKDGLRSLKLKALSMTVEIKGQNRQIEDNTAKYAEYLKSYREIINRTVALSREFKIEDSKSLCLFLTNLLWAGYFSYDRSYRYGRLTHKFLPLEQNGVDVLSGKGVCKNNSALLADFLESSGVQASFLANYATSDGDTFSWVSIFSGISKILKTENHVMNLVRGESGLYIYDPNLMVPGDILSTKKATATYKGAAVQYKLAPLKSYERLADPGRRDLLEKFMLETEPIDHLDQQEWDECYGLCMEKIKSNLSLLRSFREDIEPLIDETVKGLRLVK